MPFSLEDKHIIVTYHYVRNPSADFSGIYPCPLDEFEKQIEFLSHNYRICSISDVFEGAVAKNEERLCALTFDDGLKDHYVNVPSVLKKYSVKATFFIITNVFNGFLPLAHKLHVLLSRFGIEELIIAFDKSLLDKPFGNSKRVNYGGDFRIDNFKEA
ncbi:MAG: polysaccharide deacetylase family protein, partial [Candidatus Omnitrophota bacterium]